MDDVRAELSVARPAGHRAGRALATLSLIVALAGLVACGASRPAAAYAGLQPTKERAAQAVVDGLAARDTARLAELAISDVEFRDYIWPSLPAGRPEVGMPAEYVWADTSLRSRGQLAETIEQHGGRRLTVDAVRFAGATTDYGQFRVHADTWVRVRDAEGRSRELRLFGSMVETPAGWKVYSYIVD